MIFFPAGDVTLWKKSPLAVHVTSLSNLSNEISRAEEATGRGRSRHFRVPWLLGPTECSGNAQKLASNQPQYHDFELAALKPIASGITLFSIPSSLSSQICQAESMTWHVPVNLTSVRIPSLSAHGERRRLQGSHVRY